MAADGDILWQQHDTKERKLIKRIDKCIVQAWNLLYQGVVGDNSSAVFRSRLSKIPYTQIFINFLIQFVVFIFLFVHISFVLFLVYLIKFMQIHIWMCFFLLFLYCY